jgi:hypothetical protein
MQGAPKRQVNAEEMLAELKRALESSARASSAPPPSATTVSKASSPGQEIPRSQIDKESGRPAKATASGSIGQPTNPQKSTRPTSRRWMLTAAGLALAGAAAVWASLALMNNAADVPTHESPVAATEGLVRSQNEQSLEPSSSPRAPMQDSPQAAPPQAGALETRPDASAAPADTGSFPAGGKAGVEAPHFGPSGLESAPRAFMPVPPNQAATPVPTHRIGPDGAPIGTAPSSPASPDSAPPLAEAPKPAASQKVKPDAAPIATAPTPASTDSTHPAETPKLTAAPVVPQMAKPEAAPIATAPTPAATDSAPQLETPKPNATPTAHVSNESTQPSTRKGDSKKKPLEKASLPKPLRSPTPPVKPIAEAERQSTEPAPPKEAERSPESLQGAGSPTAAAPAKAPSVQQRVADGVTHAFGYLVHLPGALVPHLGGPNPDAH